MRHSPSRMNRTAGIAIGPILFIVAILAVLATAIAAGSSTFATSSSGETNRTNAAALIQIGQNLKMGVDRIVALGTPMTSVVINASNTVNNADLFSPTGGGLVPPATTLSSTGSDAWAYGYAVVTNLGTTTNDRVAFLKVTQGVCDQINSQTGGVATAGATRNADLGGNMEANITNTWPTGQAGKMVGCIVNTNGTPAHYFYQILGVQ